jgi:hypothetical protein
VALLPLLVAVAAGLLDEDWAWVAGRTVSREQAANPRSAEVKRPNRMNFSLIF